MRAISAVKAKTIGVYAADHVPKILSPTPIAIVTNLDTSNKPQDRIGLPFTSTGMDTAFISIATDSHRSQHTISITSEETAYVFNGIRKNYKVSIRQCVENIVLFFCIICVMVVLYARFVASFQVIRISTTK